MSTCRSFNTSVYYIEIQILRLSIFINPLYILRNTACFKCGMHPLGSMVAAVYMSYRFKIILFQKSIKENKIKDCLVCIYRKVFAMNFKRVNCKCKYTGTQMDFCK